MGRIFNIAGPCLAAKHYMLPACSRLPNVMRLIEDESYFVVHAQRQCGKTTAFQSLMDEINSSDDRVALYCSVEAAQGFTDPIVGLREIAGQIRDAVQATDDSVFGGLTDYELKQMVGEVDVANVVKRTLNVLSERCGKKQLVVFFDEVDCLSEGTLVGFLRQLRNGRITFKTPGTFPSSIALIGMRDIRDYKAKIRPDSETLGSASPFNVITEAMTLRIFTMEEVAKLYRQHTDQTGQQFEPKAVELAFEYSCGQPYLVNALARWCVDKIHDRRYGEVITAADMHEAKEKIIRERCANLNSIWKRVDVDWAETAFGCVGKCVDDSDVDVNAVKLAKCHGMVDIIDGIVKYSCPIVYQAIQYYRSPITFRAGASLGDSDFFSDLAIDGKTIHVVRC